MGRKLISVFLVVCLLSLLPMTAFARSFDENRLGSVSVTLMDQGSKTPIQGGELSIYYVATVGLNADGLPSYIFTDAFQYCGTELDDPALAGVLDGFVQRYALPVEKQVTDPQGFALFRDLPLGLYFVKQTNTVAGYANCTSFLVTVPNYNQEGFVYDVNATPKTDIARLTSITIKKVWNTDGAASAADRVTVQLLKDGVAIETAVLNRQNNWQVTYSDMPESDGYSILELDVPKGFTATYQQKGYVFTVTNTATLIQTGQLVWPIPVLALAGIVFLMAGFVILRKPGERDA